MLTYLIGLKIFTFVIGVPRSRNGVTTSECRYLVSGEEWLPKKDFLGYDFYGFTPETRTRNKHSKEEVDATYKGKFESDKGKGGELYSSFSFCNA